MSTIDQAHFYHEQGFSIFPTEQGGKDPVVKWKQYQDSMPTEAQIDDWYSGSGYNIGIATGPVSGLLVLDVDGPQGEETIKNKKNPTTAMAITPRDGGKHYYYKWPSEYDKDQITIGSGFLPGLDYRGYGGFVVAPPSTRPDGVYEWQVGLGIQDTKLAEPPQWFLDKIVTGPTSETTGDKSSVPTGSKARERQYQMLAQSASSDGARNWRELLSEGVGEGKRNNSALAVASYLFSAGLKQIPAWEMLKLWNKRNNPPLGEDELEDVFQQAIEYDTQDNLEEIVESTAEQSTSAELNPLFDRFENIKRIEYEDGEFEFRFDYVNEGRTKIELTELQLTTKYQFRRKIMSKTGDWLGGAGNKLEKEVYEMLVQEIYARADHIDATDESAFTQLVDLVVDELASANKIDVNNSEEIDGLNRRGGALSKKLRNKVMIDDECYYVSLSNLHDQINRHSEAQYSTHDVADALRSIGFDSSSETVRVKDAVLRVWVYDTQKPGLHWPPTPEQADDEMVVEKAIEDQSKNENQESVTG